MVSPTTASRRRVVLMRASREDPPRVEGGGDLADPRRERRLAERHAPLLGEIPDAVERVGELLRELRPDLVARPEEPPEVLHPLEVRDGDPARVREDVREDRDLTLAEDLVRLERGRAVRALHDQPGLHVRRVVARHLVLAGRKDEDVAVELEELLVREPEPCVAALERAVLT